MTAKSTILVSVIISFFNEADFLTDAIESVVNQSYSDWEIILVDDGSVDKSSSIAIDYVTKYPGKIFYLAHENNANRGLSFSRNQGLAIAKGDLIAILDADDIWLKEKLKIQVHIMGEYPKAAMLCEASLYWYYPWHLNSERNEVIKIGNEIDRLFEPLELSKKLYPLSVGAAPCPSGIIIKKEILIKHGAFESKFTGKFQSYEDQAFLQKIYLNEYVYISSCCNNKYRQRSGSLVAKMKRENEYYEVRKYFLEWLQNYISQYKFYDIELTMLLKKAMQPTKESYKNAINKFIAGIKNKLKITGSVN